MLHDVNQSMIHGSQSINQWYTNVNQSVLHGRQRISILGPLTSDEVISGVMVSYVTACAAVSTIEQAGVDFDSVLFIKASTHPAPTWWWQTGSIIGWSDQRQLNTVIVVSAGLKWYCMMLLMWKYMTMLIAINLHDDISSGSSNNSQRNFPRGLAPPTHRLCEYFS